MREYEIKDRLRIAIARVGDEALEETCFGRKADFEVRPQLEGIVSKIVRSNNFERILRNFLGGTLHGDPIYKGILRFRGCKEEMDSVTQAIIYTLGTESNYFTRCRAAKNVTRFARRYKDGPLISFMQVLKDEGLGDAGVVNKIIKVLDHNSVHAAVTKYKGELSVIIA